MSWDEIKKDKDKLLKKLIELKSYRDVGDKYDVCHTTVYRWAKKHDISPEDYKNPKEIKEGKEEIKHDYEFFSDEDGDYYLIYRQGDKEDVKITEKQLQKFKYLYCNKYTQETLNHCVREFEDLTREEIYAVKTAFSITHDDIEFTEKQLQENSVSELTQRSLKRKKRAVYKNIEKKSLKSDLRELNKLRQEDYIVTKWLNGLSEIVPVREYEKPNYDFNVKTDKKKSVILNLADMHVGKKVRGKNLLSGFGDYNKDVFKRSKEKLLKETIKYLKIVKPEKLYVLNYGDGADDPAGNTYPGQKDNQDLRKEEQLMSYIDALSDILFTLRDYIDDIHYSAVPGNHSDSVNWDIVASMALERRFERFDDITFDSRIKPDKIHNIYDSYLIQTHGKDIRTGKYTRERDLLSMLKIAGISSKKSYICQAHLHHKESFEGAGFEFILVPSFVGGDGLAENKMRTTSRPRQLLFTMTEEGKTNVHSVYFD